MFSTLVFFLLITHIFSKKLYIKIIHTPIYEPLKLCIFHNIVFMKKTPFNDNHHEYDDVYAIDFSPVDNIFDWRIALKLLLGKSVKGKLRLVYFDRIDKKSIQKEIMSREPVISFEGFTGTPHPAGASCEQSSLTKGAVKPRSSLDVVRADDLRSVKSTDDETIDDIDPDLYDKIINWKPLFQLYNHNCKHFSRYLSE